MMLSILGTLRTIKRNFLGIVAAIAMALALVFKMKADRVEEKNEELERDVHKLEIEVQAGEVRSRPVPRDKHDILGRM